MFISKSILLVDKENLSVLNNKIFRKVFLLFYNLSSINKKHKYIQIETSYIKNILDKLT